MTSPVYSANYDAEGNLLTKASIATGEVVEYDWDHRNRLVGITFKDGQGTVTETIEYEYDAFNRRITKIHDADGPGAGTPIAIHYVYDGDDIVLTYDENGDLLDRYLHGPAVDQILASEDASGDVLYALTDNLGTVRDLVDNTGTHVEHRTYDAFGNILTDDNPAIDFLFSYTAREWDADAGLQYNRARWYDASTGRWLNQDPIGFAAGDTNLYRYVGNDPANRTDSTGLDWWYDLGRSGWNPANWTGIPFASAGLIHWRNTWDEYAITHAEKDLQARLEQQNDSSSMALAECYTEHCKKPLGASTTEGLQEGMTATAGTYGSAFGWCRPKPGVHLAPDSGTPSGGGGSPGAPKGLPTPKHPVPSVPKNPTTAPGPDWTWRGKPGEPIGGDKGAWFNPKTGETMHPDLGHGGSIGPHWDWRDPDGNFWRLFPDGRIEPRG